MCPTIEDWLNTMDFCIADKIYYWSIFLIWNRSQDMLLNWVMLQNSMYSMETS